MHERRTEFIRFRSAKSCSCFYKYVFLFGCGEPLPTKLRPAWTKRYLACRCCRNATEMYLYRHPPTVNSRPIALCTHQRLSPEPSFSPKRATPKTTYLVSQPMHFEYSPFQFLGERHWTKDDERRTTKRRGQTTNDKQRRRRTHDGLNDGRTTDDDNDEVHKYSQHKYKYINIYITIQIVQ